MKIRAAVVDDEELARLKLSRFLSEEPSIELVHVLPDGAQALDALREDPVDLVFLDIRMPGLNGFQVLERLGSDVRPHVIFTTAFDDYALDAFAVHALDYLLKPFDRKRFREAVAFAKKRIDAKQILPESILRLLQASEPEADFPKRLAIRDGGRVIFVETPDLHYVEAAGNYLELHLAERTLLYRQTLTRLETILDPAHFARIHRSHLVNLEQVSELVSEDQHRCRVILKDGTSLNVGRSYREKLTSLLLQNEHTAEG